eukprot:4964079-Prymnesium_polylepis.1
MNHKQFTAVEVSFHLVSKPSCNPVNLRTCVKAGGAGGFPHLLPCVGGCCGGFGRLLIVVLVPCVSVVASRIMRIARRIECTPNARETRAQRTVRPWRCPTG